MNKSDLRVVKTLRQIDEALVQELEDLTVRQLTVSSLCRRALINKSTFYRYYRDMDDCLNRFLDGLLQDFRAGLRTGFLSASPGRIDDQNYQEEFFGLIRLMRERSRAYYAAWAAPIQRRLYDEMIQELYTVLLKATGPEEESGGIPYRQLYCRLFAEHTMTLFRWWFENAELVTEQDVHSIMTENMKHGFFAAFRRMS